MSGRIVGIFFILAMLIAGGGLYYTQVYAFYDDPKSTEAAVLSLKAAGLDEQRDLPVTDMISVDKDSSPLGYRACFTVKNSLAMLTETYELIEAVPLEAPNWFHCFDADEIGLAIEEGRALTFLGQHEIKDGVDRVIAVLDDGRGFAWHQLNEKYEK